jgi:Signal transduction histidine kinase
MFYLSNPFLFRFRLVYLTVILLVPDLAFTQQRLAFNKFSVEDGLLANHVKCVAQDKSGFMWIGTLNGLQKFDGNKFLNPFEFISNNNIPFTEGVQQIQTDNNGRFFLFLMNNQFAYFDPVTLENRIIPIKAHGKVEVKADYHLFKDSGGRIYMCANNYGLLVYDSIHNVFTEDNVPIKIPRNWAVNSLYEDVHSGKYWICSDSGMAVYNRNTGELFYKNHNPENNLLLKENRRAMYLLIDSKKRYWLVYWTFDKKYEEHVMRYDSNSNTVIINPGGIELEGFAQVRNLLETKDGVIWISGFQTLLTLYPEQKSFIQNKESANDISGINFSLVNNLFEDREKNIWICTDKGLFVSYPNANKISNYLFAESKDIYTLSLLSNNKNEIWSASWGRGILVFDSLLNPLPKYQFHLPRYAMCLYKEKNSNIVWAGFANGELALIDVNTKKVLKRLKPKALGSWPVNQIAEDADGNLWFGLTGRIVKWIKTKTIKEEDFNVVTDFPLGLQTLYIDNHNKLWVGTRENGILKYEIYRDKLIKAFENGSTPIRLYGNIVMAIRALNDSIYFIGTNAGLNILNTHTGKIRKLNSVNGLTGNYVNCLEIDSSGILWMGTFSSLCSYDIKTDHFTSYNKNDGLLSAESIRAISFNNDKMVLAGINFISSLNADVLTYTNQPPNVQLTDFKILNNPVNDDSILKLKKLTLPYNKSSFTISFASPSYRQKDKLTYYYKLEGADNEWIKADRSQQVNYSLLPPGNYTFQVKCINDRNIAVKDITLFSIIVTPPYWYSWWFIALCAISIALIIHYVYRLRINRILAVEKVRQKVARDLHDDMGSTLSTINILSSMAKNKIKNDPVKVSEYIGKISDNSSRMMEAMDDIVWNINPANDDMQKTIARMREFATNVLEAKDIIFWFNFDDSINNVRLNMEQRRDVFLIFKEAINNAAKYSHCNKVVASISQTGKTIHLSIVDDGDGFDIENADNGNGLKNMQRRARHLNGKIKFNSEPLKGTSIVVDFPSNN